MSRSYSIPEPPSDNGGPDSQETNRHSNDGGTQTLSRRGFIGGAIAALGLPALMGRASAQSSDAGASCTWLGDQDAAGYAGFSAQGWAFINGDASNFDVPSGETGIAVNSSKEFVKVAPDGTLTPIATKGNGGLSQVATGTVTATGGSSPAVNTTLAAVSTDQLLDYVPAVYVDSDPSWNADYAWNYDYEHQWDNSATELDINLTVNWDTDPGSGNDLTLRWEVLTY